MNNYEIVKTGKYYDYECQERDYENDRWCGGNIDPQTGRCERCGHRAASYGIFERRITGRKIVDVNIDGERVRVNSNVVNEHIDIEESLEGAVIDRAVQKIYGRRRSFWKNCGYPHDRDYAYGQIVEPCSTGGYNCVTPIVRAEILYPPSPALSQVGATRDDVVKLTNTNGDYYGMEMG